MSDAISIYTDFKIYHDELNLGYYEALAQNTNIFNAASRNAILLLSDFHQGNYMKRAGFKQVTDLVTRQDITSTSAVDSKKLEQIEEAAVKLHSKVGPVQYTLNSFDLAGLETPEGSMALGRLLGDAIAKRKADLAIMSANAAVGAQTSLIFDATVETTKYCSFKNLNKARGKFGDQLSLLRCFIMHSTPYLDLVEDGMDIGLDTVAGVTYISGNVPGLLGAGLIVSDNSNLYASGSPVTYNVLGVKEAGVVVRDSQELKFFVERVTGLEQLAIEIQGEFAVTIGIDGYTWDVTNGGANPTDANLATTTNWDKVRTDTTGLPVCKLKCQAV